VTTCAGWPYRSEPTPSLVIKTASDEPIAPPMLAITPLTYMIQAEDHTWLIAEMWLGSSASWVATTRLVLRRRRSLEMKPRAIHLIDSALRDRRCRHVAASRAWLVAGDPTPPASVSPGQAGAPSRRLIVSIFQRPC